MAAISDPEAVRFVNEKIRPAAFSFLEAYHLLREIQQEWFAANMGSLIPNTSDLVADGADVSGAHQLTGAAVTNVVTRAIEVVADLEANANAKLNTIIVASVR